MLVRLKQLDPLPHYGLQHTLAGVLQGCAIVLSNPLPVAGSEGVIRCFHKDGPILIVFRVRIFAWNRQTFTTAHRTRCHLNGGGSVDSSAGRRPHAGISTLSRESSSGRGISLGVSR